MKRNFAAKLVFVLLIITISLNSNMNLSAQTSNTQKNILILNSYHSGFQWTDDQTSGILSCFSSQDLNYNISIEYMDWKRYPSETNLTNFYNSIQSKYSGQKLDVILCTDDAAFSFALKYQKDLFSNAPIVFSGINNEGLTQLTNGQGNFTGVVEENDPESTIRAALNINPSSKSLYLIYDNTESGLSTGQISIADAKKIDSNLNIVSLNKQSSKDIIDTISTIDKDSIVLVTSYFQDIDGTTIDNQDFCEELSKNSPVPIYHLYDFGLGHGIIGGNLIIAKNQGQEAGLLAQRILNGEQAITISYVEKYSNQYTFDYTILKKYNISTSVLPKDSHIINTPFSFFKTYRTLVLVVLFIFFLLVSFTIILLIYIRRIRIMQLKLSANNEELSQLYEELTASEEELRAQFLEVSSTQEQLEDYSLKLEHLAYHDSLTGLYNRLYLYDELKKELDDSSRNNALLYIDIDNFKLINDALGHDIGDELLKEISLRLQDLSTKDTLLFSLGGDEFIYYIKGNQTRSDVEEFAKTILNLMSNIFFIGTNQINVTASLGIAISSEDGTNLNTLLRNADIAMNKMKSNGKNGYYLFNSNLKDELIERLNIENNFKKALSGNEFVIFYQPQINTDTYEIDGFEALIRWFSPELGMLSPLKFIKYAEESGFITVLGEWILRNSCIFTKAINNKYNTNYKISVNISVIQLLQNNFESIVKQVLIDTDLSPRLLELEITESVIMESPELVAEKIAKLRSMGVQIALDDFGTGYSSLSYLINIPITTLKIDKSFVDNISSLDTNMQVTDSIINLGHKMNLTIVAEGVETEEQLKYLILAGCDKIQGYLFSKPLPEQDLDTFIYQHNLKYNI